MKLHDRRGTPIERGDVVKVFHFVGARRKRLVRRAIGMPTQREDYS